MLRALELRQKILVGSHAEGEVKYDRDLVQTILLQILRVGLMNESVKNHMLPFLDPSKKVTDDVLIREVNMACSEVAERDKKHRAEKKKVQASEVNVTIEMMQPLMESLKMLKDKLVC